MYEFRIFLFVLLESISNTEQKMLFFSGTSVEHDKAVTRLKSTRTKQLY
jgi:hypothetical protein